MTSDPGRGVGVTFAGFGRRVGAYLIDTLVAIVCGGLLGYLPYDLGNGYGHLAVSVQDLDAEHARFEAEGLAPRKLVEFAPAGEIVARFFFVADPDGYQIEVLERGGRFK